MQHDIIRQSEPRGLPLHFKLLPEWLNGLGYSSYMVGKWHLGFYKSEFTPTRRGFSTHVGSWGGFVDYYIHDQRAPMFLYVAHLAPHAATERELLQVPKIYLRGYDDIGHVNRTLYAGIVSALDKSVGDVFKALYEEGMLEDSVLMFTSDNGAASTYHGLDAASSWPLKGEKGALWEGGVRVPGFVWAFQNLWRGPGSIYERFFHVTDWLPTLYEMAVKCLGTNCAKR
ncbi:hypothetical protein HPB52_017332 [Rhipicephalus sanguineus]|uniref:Sulfatase N-terminal domain-containing protein n=1 Tax=Rhipicephalus sanguineus TaxID=34632 RepID=A0A9D4SZD8_RHISA|nr:hypothetical protein HPB52_017332 [Rhipicephalus sanguineus]